MKQKEIIDNLKDEYKYHSRQILEELLDKGYELVNTIGYLDELLKEEE